MAETATRPGLTGRPRSDQDKGGGGSLLLAGLLLAGGGLALYEANKHHSTTVTPVGTCPPFPTGLYAAADGVVYFVNGCQRWGVPSPTQLARCFSGLAVTPLGSNSFGNADTCDFVVTVGDITACSTCPPGSPGA